MATNEDAGFVEQHVEKIVLGVAVAILIFAGFYWGLSSPREIELKVRSPIHMSKKNYKPSEVDKALKEASEKMAERIKRGGGTKEVEKHYRDRLEGIYNNPNKSLRDYIVNVRRLEPKKFIELIQWVSGRKVLKPEEKRVDDHKAIRLADLRPLPKPERPLVLINSEMQLISRKPQAGTVRPATVRPPRVRRERIPRDYERTEGRRPSEVRPRERTEGRRPSEVRPRERTEGRRPSEFRPRPPERTEVRRGEHERERETRSREGDRTRRDRGTAPPEGFEYKEVDVVHGVVVFEFGKVIEKWREAMKKTYAPARVVFLAVEVQRRYSLPSGTWSEPENVPSFTIPGTEPLPIIPVPDGTNLREIRDKVADLAWIGNQEKILEPPYYDILWPNRDTGTWQIVGHKPPTKVCELVPKPEEELETPVRPGERRRPEEVDRRREEEKRKFQKELDRKRRMEDERKRQRALELKRREEERKRRSETSRRSDSSSRSRRDSRSEREGRGEHERRPERERRTEGDRRPREGDRDRRPKPVKDEPLGPVEPTIVLIPLLKEQLANPKGILEVWFHDTKPEEGMTYSYRLRLVLVNPLVGSFSDVIDKDDAKVPALKTPWSDWSEPVDVKRPTEFFVVGYAKQMGTRKATVKVEVFTQRWGQRIMHSFTVHKGEPIGHDVTKEIMQPDNHEVQNKVVSFKTGAIAVDFDFEKKIRRKGMYHPLDTMELLYLDANGRLCTRTEYEDRKSKKYEKLLREASPPTPEATVRR